MLACSRRSSMNAWGKSAISRSFLELHDRDAAATLFRGRRCKSRDQGMLLQEAGERALQLTGAVPVNQTDDALIHEQRLVEETFGAGQGFIDGAADHVQIQRGRFARLKFDVDVDA